ncbi:MAG: DUF1987 domain-containing protein [Cyclobacteriaceae bacterium]
MNFKINPTNTTPYVSIDPLTKSFDMKGRSSPESAVMFYSPVIYSIKDSVKEVESFSFNFDMEYFNTSSSKCIFDILKVAKTARNSGQSIIVNWYYEDWDEDMREAGEDYEHILKIPFNYIELSK